MLAGRRDDERPIHLQVRGGAQGEAIEFMNAIMTHVRPRIEAEVLFTDEELRRLTVPVRLVLGARDALRASARIAARLQSLLPRLTTVLLPEAGHVLAGMAERVISFWDTMLPKAPPKH